MEASSRIGACPPHSSVPPPYPTVPPEPYRALVLVDAVRVKRAREGNRAVKLLTQVSRLIHPLLEEVVFVGGAVPSPYAHPRTLEAAVTVPARVSRAY